MVILIFDCDLIHFKLDGTFSVREAQDHLDVRGGRGYNPNYGERKENL